jgi:uncharacterized SAM-binding protein YcdF (DUF218 family)
LFRKAGFEVEAYPVDWRTSKPEVLWFSSVSTNGLERTDVAMREWIGLLAYRLTGKIDDFLPEPRQK